MKNNKSQYFLEIVIDKISSFVKTTCMWTEHVYTTMHVQYPKVERSKRSKHSKQAETTFYCATYAISLLIISLYINSVIFQKW